MTANFSHQRALRLPRDLALIAVGLDAMMFVINMAALLLRSTPDAEQIRHAYMQPGVWIVMLAGLAMACMLGAALAWSHGRHALETRGVADVALAHDARLRFGCVWVLAMVLNYYVLMPQFYQFQAAFMAARSSPLLGLDMALLTLLQSLTQLAVMVLGLWLAARFALRRRPAAPARADEDALAEAGIAGASPRRAIATVVAGVFVSLHLWSGLAAARWLPVGSDADVPTLLLVWVLPSLATAALAFWGGWLGARPVLSGVRPFRAVAASLSAFVLLLVCSIVIAFAWLFIGHGVLASFGGMGGLLASSLVLALAYMALVVALTRGLTRGFYRRYL